MRHFVIASVVNGSSFRLGSFGAATAWLRHEPRAGSHVHARAMQPAPSPPAPAQPAPRPQYQTAPFRGSRPRRAASYGQPAPRPRYGQPAPRPQYGQPAAACASDPVCTATAAATSIRSAAAVDATRRGATAAELRGDGSAAAAISRHVASVECKVHHRGRAHVRRFGPRWDRLAEWREREWQRHHGESSLVQLERGRRGRQRRKSVRDAHADVPRCRGRGADDRRWRRLRVDLWES